jgi:dolichol-phosphate mannosyltransferase
MGFQTRVSELAIVLPTYNEADNLAIVVRELEHLEEDLEVLVVDDNSQDGTQQVAQELSRAYGNVTVIARPGKLGLGSALRLGLAEALETGARYVITMDADQSHDPRDVVRLLQAIRREAADMVQGSRYVEGGGTRRMAVGRRWSSRVVNLIYHWLAGAPRESTTNFRVFSRRAASLVAARAKGRDYEFVPEAMLLVLAAGLAVGEVPIVFTGRARGSSKLGLKQAVKGVASVFSASLQYRLRLGRFARPSSAGDGAGKLGR